MEELIVKNAALADMIKCGNSPLDQLVKRMVEKDPAGYSDGRMTPQKARISAMLQDNMLRDLGKGQFSASMNDDCRSLFSKHGMLYDQMAKASGKTFQDTITGSDIATIATQILPVITRAVAENPIFSPTFFKDNFCSEYSCSISSLYLSRRILFVI